MMNYLIKIFNKLNTNNTGIFRIIYANQARNYTLHYDTIDNVISKKEMSESRTIIYYLFLFMNFFQMFKFAILNFNHDPFVQVMLGDVTFLFLSKYTKLSAFWFVCTVILTFGKMVTCYYEHSANNPSIKIIFATIKKSTFLRLTQKNEKKLILGSNILYWLYLRLFCANLFYLLMIVYPVLALMAYFYSDYHFTIINIIVIVVATVFNNMNLNNGINWFAGGVILVYILTHFLLMKMEEIVTSIRVNIRWRNRVKLLEDMRQYDQFIKFLNAFTRPVNMVLGVGYLMLPNLSLQVWEVFMWKNNEPADKWFKLTLGIFVIIILFDLVVINYFAALLAFRHKSIHKYFYMVICDKSFQHGQTSDHISFYFSMSQLSNIKFILKVESFIAKLSKQNIGFRMLNIFSVTVKFLKMNVRNNKNTIKIVTYD